MFSTISFFSLSEGKVVSVCGGTFIFPWKYLALKVVYIFSVPNLMMILPALFDNSRFHVLLKPYETADSFALRLLTMRSSYLVLFLFVTLTVDQMIKLLKTSSLVLPLSIYSVLIPSCKLSVARLHFGSPGIPIIDQFHKHMIMCPEMQGQATQYSPRESCTRHSIPFLTYKRGKMEPMNLESRSISIEFTYSFDLGSRIIGYIERARGMDLRWIIGI